jgi:hypothetical protein
MADEAQSLREFLREELLLSRKSFDANMAAMTKLTARIEAGTAELRRHTEQMNRDHRDFYAESRAQRQALLRILDRLDGGNSGGAAPAT